MFFVNNRFILYFLCIINLQFTSLCSIQQQNNSADTSLNSNNSQSSNYSFNSSLKRLLNKSVYSPASTFKEISNLVHLSNMIKADPEKLNVALSSLQPKPITIDNFLLDFIYKLFQINKIQYNVTNWKLTWTVPIIEGLNAIITYYKPAFSATIMGNTALYMACKIKNKALRHEIINLFLDNGAKTTLSKFADETPFIRLLKENSSPYTIYLYLEKYNPSEHSTNEEVMECIIKIFKNWVTTIKEDPKNSIFVRAILDYLAEYGILNEHTISKPNYLDGAKTIEDYIKTINNKEIQEDLLDALIIE